MKGIILFFVLIGCAMSCNVQSFLTNAGCILVDNNFMPLYVFNQDTQGTSLVTPVTACTSSDCKTNWPPVTVDATEVLTGCPDRLTKYVDSFTRADNSLIQLTFYGWPLYSFIGDRVVNNFGGQGVKGVSDTTTGFFYVISCTGSVVETHVPPQNIVPIESFDSDDSDRHNLESFLENLDLVSSSEGSDSSSVTIRYHHDRKEHGKKHGHH
jgi:predicted lipoprotein with Yx(FWY)xxD motif